MTSPLRQIERLEVGEHLRALREACERNILTRFVEARPELVDLGIRVRAFDRVVGLPLEDFDDGAVLRTHRLSGPLRDEFLSAEHGHMVAHAIEQLCLLPRVHRGRARPAPNDESAVKTAYSSPFAWRYGRPAMRALFSEETKRRMW